MTTTTHPAIRPTIQQLRQMPTLRQERHRFGDVEGMLELKSEAPGRRFWTCSGPPPVPPGTDLPSNFLPDHVTMEVIDEQSGQSHWFAYGPADTRELQMLDYFNLLGKQLDDLLAQEKPENDPRDELEAIRGEFRALQKLWSKG